MNTNTREIVAAHWATANAKDWDGLAALLDEGDFRYDVPQTREHVTTAAGYLDVFVTWPGSWHVVVRDLICDGHRAVCRFDFVSDGEAVTGIQFFEVSAEGRIRRVTDYWPESYEPPPRMSKHMVRTD